jgi:hypothetical protein
MPGEAVFRERRNLHLEARPIKESTKGAEFLAYRGAGRLGEALFAVRLHVLSREVLAIPEKREPMRLDVHLHSLEGVGRVVLLVIGEPPRDEVFELR